jgi:hypothetical protein
VQGLDPASRRNLWDVVKGSKGGRGIVLTTHSMEEAETLCDRLGIFVDGQLVCIGNPKEITSRCARGWDGGGPHGPTRTYLGAEPPPPHVQPPPGCALWSSLQRPSLWSAALFAYRAPALPQSPPHPRTLPSPQH